MCSSGLIMHVSPLSERTLWRMLDRCVFFSRTPALRYSLSSRSRKRRSSHTSSSIAAEQNTHTHTQFSQIGFTLQKSAIAQQLLHNMWPELCTHNWGKTQKGVCVSVLPVAITPQQSDPDIMDAMRIFLNFNMPISRGVVLSLTNLFSPSHDKDCVLFSGTKVAPLHIFFTTGIFIVDCWGLWRISSGSKWKGRSPSKVTSHWCLSQNPGLSSLCEVQSHKVHYLSGAKWVRSSSLQTVVDDHCWLLSVQLDLCFHLLIRRVWQTVLRSPRSP